MPKIAKNSDPVEIAYFRFGVIAPIIQGTFPDASEAAYYRRVVRIPWRDGPATTARTEWTG